MTPPRTYRATITCDSQLGDALYAALREDLADHIADDADMTWASTEVVITLVSDAPSEVERLVERRAPGAVLTWTPPPE